MRIAAGPHGDVQPGVGGRQVPVGEHIVGVEQLLTAHVLVARRDIALADVELPGPARDGVLIEAEYRVLAVEQVPGRGAATEGIHFVPAQVTPPAADAVPRRAAAAARQHGEADVLHLVEVEDARQADYQGEDAGQQAALQAAGFVPEAAPRRGQPTQSPWQQQESAGVLGVGPEKGGAGSGTGWPGGTAATQAEGGAGTAAGGSAAGGLAGVRRWRPYFLRKRYRATRETRTSQVRRIKSRMS